MVSNMTAVKNQGIGVKGPFLGFNKIRAVGMSSAISRVRKVTGIKNEIIPSGVDNSAVPEMDIIMYIRNAMHIIPTEI